MTGHGRTVPLGSVGQARRLLARRDGWIGAEGGLYAVRTGADRRARILLLVDETVLRQLAEAPGLRRRAGGGWTSHSPVNGAGVAPEPGRPGAIDGVRLLVDADGAVTPHRANLGQSAIVWLARRLDGAGRPWLGAAEIAAADRLARDAEAALRGPSLTTRWDALPRSARGSARVPVAPGQAALAAGQRVERALASCGPARGVVEAICIRCSALQAAESDLGLGRRRGKILLKQGLSALAAHYRIG